MSNQRTPLTDADIEAQRKSGAHKRSEYIDNTFTCIMILTLCVAGFICIAGILLGGVMYAQYIIDPKSANKDSIELIQTLATHALAAVGGYIVHIAKRVGKVET